jgi:hypothetical protein
MRSVLLALGGLAGIAIVVAVVLVVTGGDDGSEPGFKASTSVELTAGETSISRVAFRPNAPTELAPEVQDQILGILSRYVDEGTVAPLRSGKADDAVLAELFDGPAVARLAGTDRAVLLDEGLPKAVGKVDGSSPPVAMAALENADGNVVFVSAAVELTITAETETGTVEIARAGSIVLAPDPTTGWKITGWTLHVDRAGPGVAKPVTTSPPTTTAVNQ